MNSSKPVKVVLVGASITGNRGAESMLRAAIEHISKKVPGAQFVLLSLYPDDDRRENDDPGLSVVPFTPKQLVLAGLPLAVLYGAARRLALEGHFFLPLAALREVRDADLVVDLSGISFVDGRGYGILLYNVILAVLPSLLGTRGIKYAQAVGPFKDPLNRLAAKFSLKYVSRIAARGRISLQHLRELGVPEQRLSQCADAAFAMSIRPEAEEAAQHWLSHPAFSRSVVALSASSVVLEYCKARGIDYVQLMAELIEYLTHERGYGVLLLPHSTRVGKRSHKNNDLIVCDTISSHVGRNQWVVYPNLPEHADTLRVLIGRCRFLIASRFHAMISGLSMGVPSLLIGWSHKYAEVLEEFEMDGFALDYSEVSLEMLKERFAELEAREEELRQRIRRHLPEVTQKSIKNAELAAELLAEGVTG